MKHVIKIASELGYIKIPENTVIGETDEELSIEKMIIVTTGSQGKRWPDYPEWQILHIKQ